LAKAAELASGGVLQCPPLATLAPPKFRDGVAIGGWCQKRHYLEVPLRGSGVCVFGRAVILRGFLFGMVVGACAAAADEDGGETHWLGECDGAVPCPEKPRCGDGVVDPGEECDGRNLAGMTCASIMMEPSVGGELQCRSCNFVIAACELPGKVGRGTGGEMSSLFEPSTGGMDSTQLFEPSTGGMESTGPTGSGRLR
jgi:hypothetical protein